MPKNVEVILHAQSLHKGMVYIEPKSNGLKIPMMPCCTSALFLGEESFDRRNRWSSAKRRVLEKSPCTTVESVDFFNEPEVEKICKVRIGSSRTIDLFCSVPSTLPKVFEVRNYARAVRMPQPYGAIGGD